MPVKCPWNWRFSPWTAREMRHFQFHGPVKSASKTREKKKGPPVVTSEITCWYLSYDMIYKSKDITLHAIYVQK